MSQVPDIREQTRQAKLDDLLRTPDLIILTQEKFSAEVAPYLQFSRDAILDMLAAADDTDDGLRIITDRAQYYLSAAEVKRFFEVNQKPKRKLPLKEENVLLKKQVAEYEAELARLRGKQPEKQVFTFNRPSDPLRVLPSNDETDGLFDVIPAEEDRKPTTPDEMRAMLKAEEDAKKARK